MQSTIADSDYRPSLDDLPALDDDRLRRCAEEVESEWGMSGLASGLYFDFLRAVLEKYLRYGKHHV